MKIVVVASQNPVKIQAVAGGFRKVFPEIEFSFIPIHVSSGVPHQPRSDQETLQGAFNRKHNAFLIKPEADFWVGVEGGIEEDPLGMTAFAWIVVGAHTGIGRGRTGAFYLPARVAELVRQGKELGEADDMIFQQKNSKQSQGAIGLLTGGVVNRLELYEQAVILALIPFRNPDLYPHPDPYPKRPST